MPPVPPSHQREPIPNTVSFQAIEDPTQMRYHVTMSVDEALIVRSTREAVLEHIVKSLANKFVADHGEALLAEVDRETVLQRLGSLVAERLADRSASKLVQEAVASARGDCPECGKNPKQIKAAIADAGFLRPEFCEGLRDQGVNILTGHKNGCSLAGSR